MRQADLWRGSWQQRTRLASGLVLFVFAATHFLNHALGLVSLDAMQVFDAWRVTIIRSALGTAVLLGALLAHVGLAIWRIIQRRTLRLPLWEWTQIVLGFAIPILLLPHVVNTRIAAKLFGVYDIYPYELARIWPSLFLNQGALLLIVWVHGCMGLHFWLRQSAWYRSVAPVLLGLAVLLPFAALAGISVQGRAVAASIASPAALHNLKDLTHWPDAGAADMLSHLGGRTQLTYLLFLAGLLALVGLRLTQARRAQHIPITYSGGPTVRAEAGPTLLEISRRNNIPHMSACGGRGRCSTCRVLVLSGELAPPSEAEAATLTAIGASRGIRLACQIRPTSALTILPLLKASVEPQLSESASMGTEREFAVLFVDLRGFTALTESRLPFDVIYILNQFFGTVGQPIQDCGGWITNYAGDGCIALFGLEDGIERTCRAALVACAEIDRAMSTLNDRIGGDMHQPLRIAMGLHAGLHVMGRVGFGSSQAMSVIGLAMNVASRLETMAKGAGVQLAVSRTVADHGGLDIGGLRAEVTDMRGLSAPIEVVFIEAALGLLDRLGESALAEPAAGGSS